MSHFMDDAVGEVKRRAERLTQYGTSYAIARASGKDPWVSARLAEAFGLDIPPDAQTWMRRAVDRLVEERQRVGV